MKSNLGLSSSGLGLVPQWPCCALGVMCLYCNTASHLTLIANFVNTA